MALPKRTRKKVVRGAPRVRRGDKLSAPNWEGWQEWSGERYHRFKGASRDFYYQNYKPADLYPHTWKWMSQNGYSKEQVKNAKAAPGYELSITAAITAKQLLDGMPDLNPKEDEYWDSLPGTTGKMAPASKFLKERIERAINAGSKVVEEKKIEEKKTSNVYVPSIQERIRDQAYIQSEAIEEWLEGWITDPKSFDPKGFDFKKHFYEMKVTQAHARKLKTFYEHELDDYNDLERYPTNGQLKKMSEHEQDMWLQLKEGYSHLKKSDIKLFRTAIEELLAALNFVIDQAKATRKPRKPKVYSADKLVAKLKFKKLDEKYKLASIDPAQIIGSNELWVFNIKTRKLGKYVASNIDPKGMQREGTGLTVKGTTILGFDEKQSIQKTLRKPEEQLKEFKDAGKVKLRKFLEDIKTTDTKLNGRSNTDTILLKVI
tara:strand:+ start:2300 stop:3592 length:1293 start_codon:yes stop_codon:yes gene_type:complete